MPRPYSIKLRFGPYHTPRFRYGEKVLDERRGEVTIAGITDAQIAWPYSRATGGRSPVLYKGLVRAVRREAVCAVAHWWGVSDDLVSKWRRALGVPQFNEGTLRVNHQTHKSAAMQKALRTPARRAKIAAAKRGKPRPRHVVEAIRNAHLGKRPSAKTRRKMSAAHKRRGTYPPAAGRPWEAWEDRLVRTRSPAEAASRTKRTLSAVMQRRHKLGLPDGRRRRERRRLGR
jgi:hypothetical protein